MAILYPNTGAAPTGAPPGTDPSGGLSGTSSTSGVGTKITNPNMETRTTTFEYDPFRKFLANTLMGRMQTGNGQISPTVLAGIEQMITNPGAIGSIAGQQFADISKPLLQAQQDAFKIQNQNTMDMFRKAGVGSMQSGAFAQAARQQAADQGRQQQTLLASNYIPLTQQLSANVLGGIKAGIDAPRSELDSFASILNAFRDPTQKYEYGTSLPTSSYYVPGTSTPISGPYQGPF